MRADLGGRRVVLTGATGGIGRAIAAELAARGAALLLSGRRADALEELARELRGAGAEVQTCRADLATPEGRELLAEAAETFGADSLVNNAGTNRFAWLADQDEAAIAEQLHTNLLQPILLCRRFLPRFETLPRAQILNIGSAMGSIGLPGHAPYCASKFGLRGFSEALGRELADTGVRVGYLAPRTTRTAMNSPAAEAMNRELGNGSDAPETVARIAADMLRDGTALRFIGQPESFFTRLNSLWPGLVGRALRAKLPIMRRHAKGAAESCE